MGCQRDDEITSPPSAIGTTTIFNIPLPTMPCSSSGLLPLILQNCVYKPHLPTSSVPHSFILTSLEALIS